MLGYALLIDYQYMGPWNWDALAAIATFAAVLVALYPIYRDELRRHAAGRAVATSVIAALQVVATHLTMMLRSPVDVVNPLGTEPVSKAIDTLVTLLPRTEVLEPDEQECVARAASACEQIRNVAAGMTEPPNRKGLEWLCGVVIEANDRLSARLHAPKFHDLPGIRAMMNANQVAQPESPSRR